VPSGFLVKYRRLLTVWMICVWVWDDAAQTTHAPILQIVHGNPEQVAFDFDFTSWPPKMLVVFVRAG
jgi:hypothetical protein